MIETTALLVTAFLFGGMALFSAGFAGTLFKSLPPETAGRVLRETFPGFYLFVIVCALVSAGLTLPQDSVAGFALGLIALTTIPARQLLMPAINNARDQGQQRRFMALHSLSVGLTLGHIVLAGWVVTRFTA